MVERDYEQIKEMGRQAGRNGAKPEQCPFRGSSLHDKRDAWLAGLNVGKAERKARATR